eukprot:9267427-Alexandrium_andersonii.AAC.1
MKLLRASAGRAHFYWLKPWRRFPPRLSRRLSPTGRGCGLSPARAPNGPLHGLDLAIFGGPPTGHMGRPSKPERRAAT